MYHVVVCSNCRFVWIVQDRPQTSQCGRCRKTRQFSLLKKYHKTEDKDEAKLARAFYQSRVDGQEEHFDRALDKGVLEEDMNAFLSESQYLELQGMDADRVEDAVENILSPTTTRSEVQVIRDAFRALEDPTSTDFLAYTREHDVSDENAVIKLEGLVRSGTLSETGQIQASDIEEMADVIFDEQPDPQGQEPEEGAENTVSSHREIIEAAVDEHRGESVDAILDFAAQRGMDRLKAVVSLEKLVLSNQIGPGVELQEIADARTAVLGADDRKEEHQREPDPTEAADSASQESDQDTAPNLSQQEILERAIEDQENPTEDDVIEFATSRGLSREKALGLLQKMRQHGIITEGPGYSLRLT